MPPTPQAQVQAACLRPDGSLCSIPISLRILAVKGTSSIAECGERLAQQLSFGHFAVPGDVMAPGVRLSEVAGVSVMVLQMRNLERGYLMAVRPSKLLPPFPENTVANKMLYNQQLRVFGCALFMRHTYSAQNTTNSYVPLSVTEVNALIQALPGSAALLAEAQQLAAARKAERELAQEFTARPLVESAASAARSSGQTFSMRSFGMVQASAGGSSPVMDAAPQPKATAPAAKASPQPTPKARPPPAAKPAEKAMSQPCRAGSARDDLGSSNSRATTGTGPATQGQAGTMQGSRVPDPCPICANTYQMTRHMKQKAKCCKQRVCSECSTEILKLAGFGGRAPCPFCRYKPLEVQSVASDLEDEKELEEARKARLAEDRQLAQVLRTLRMRAWIPLPAGLRARIRRAVKLRRRRGFLSHMKAELKPLKQRSSNCELCSELDKSCPPTSACQAQASQVQLPVQVPYPNLLAIADQPLKQCFAGTTQQGVVLKDPLAHMLTVRTSCREQAPPQGMGMSQHHQVSGSLQTTRRCFASSTSGASVGMARTVLLLMDEMTW